MENHIRSHFHPPGFLATVLILSACAVGCDISMGDRTAGGSQGKEERRTSVETATGWLGDVQQTLSISTDLEARDTVDLTARVSGVVLEVLAEEGAHVGEGSLILRLDPTDLDLDLRESEILLAEANSRLGSAKLGRKEVASGAELAHVALDRAIAERQRLERLLDADGRRLASEEELERIRFSEKEATISHEKSKLSLEKMEMTLAMERQGVEKALLALERARLDRARSEIGSPFEGRIQKMELRPGELVTSGSKVATVIRTQPLLAWVRVPQSRINELRLGQEAIVTSEAARGLRFSGTVTALSPAVDPSEGTLRVRVEVEDPDLRLRAGAFATCTLILGIHKNALLVPKNARIFEGDRSILYVVRDRKAVRVEIESGLQLKEQLEILSSAPPISVDDRIVIRGQARLRDGDPVEDSRIEAETIVEEKVEAVGKEGRG
ncbi:MAG TPA: efflux RND transporter periplasmic adaptor subunit [Planctomycetes bacterium]|nr:efflux RND transporter periplasmic adaptor subunit [Planctomycetota bacterium]HIN80031.1 efflux RND transporter periplasmic adaptor subunit [Planctomycetota bacterium]